jgi:hypothetical protein
MPIRAKETGVAGRTWLLAIGAGVALIVAGVFMTPGSVVNARTFIADVILAGGVGLVWLGRRLRRQAE